MNTTFRARVLLAAVLCTALSAGQVQRHYTSPNYVSVPSSGTGGQAGGASNPANLATVTTNFPDALVISSMNAYIYLVHARAADLTMTLSHCGTSVTLFAGSANQLASLNGYYTFDDLAPTTFASAVNGAQGLVPPGSYKPAQSLGAFTGKNSSGPWVLTVADLASGVWGTAAYMQITVVSGQGFQWSTYPPIPIPDGSGGVCTAPLTQSVPAPSSGQVGMIEFTMSLQHTYLGDLTVTLSHGGVTAIIIEANSQGSPANLDGTYSFADDSNQPWAQAVAGLPTAATVPSGWYRPITPLAVFQGLDQLGPWTISVCDEFGTDVGGLQGMHVAVGRGSWNLQIQQPNGPSSITLTNSGGRMGDVYANLMTLAPGAYPNGWLYGLDIAMADILTEVAVGAPFYGQLGSCGSASTTVPGPIPSGLTVWAVSLDVDSSVNVVNVKHAFTYTTP